MNLSQVFTYNGNQVRTVVHDGEPWFAAKDLCDILEVGDARQAVERLSENQKGRYTIPTPGGNQELWCVNESGMYKLIFTSRKPEAERFTEWVTTEVLPSIRKHGLYAVDQLLNDPDLAIKAFTALKEERERSRSLEGEVKMLKPKADFFDAVANSKDAIDLGTAAKVLNMGVGRTNLFRILREKKILNRENIPYQEYIDRGYFRTIEQKYTKPDGSTCINIKSLVYQKGLNYIRKVLTERKAQ